MSAELENEKDKKEAAGKSPNNIQLGHSCCYFCRCRTAVFHNLRVVDQLGIYQLRKD